MGIGGPDDAANFDHFGEATDVKQRAGMLDEGLAILSGLWSGEPFSYRGLHYQIAETTFLPKPVQQPRVPIWIGGNALKAGPVRRAARWDGIVPVPVDLEDGGWRYLTPHEVKVLRETIERQRAGGGPFDIAIGGGPRGEDWEEERDRIASLAEAGATWWLEWVPAADPATMRAAIARSPLCIPEGRDRPRPSVQEPSRS